jgi:hypothetical protein
MQTLTDLFGNEKVVNTPEELINDMRKKGFTYGQISSKLNALDLKNRTNSAWTPQSVKRRHRRAQGLKG